MRAKQIIDEGDETWALVDESDESALRKLVESGFASAVERPSEAPRKSVRAVPVASAKEPSATAL